MTVAQSKPDYLSKMAQFLQDLSLAWEAAEQQQRKRLVAEVFEAVWVKDALILGVTPKADMMPFFDMVHGEASTVLQTYGPDGGRTLGFKLSRRIGPLPGAAYSHFRRACPRSISLNILAISPFFKLQSNTTTGLVFGGQVRLPQLGRCFGMLELTRKIAYHNLYV